MKRSNLYYLLVAFPPKILRLHTMYVAKFLEKNHHKILTNLQSFHMPGTYRRSTQKESYFEVAASTILLERKSIEIFLSKEPSKIPAKLTPFTFLSKR